MKNFHAGSDAFFQHVRTPQMRKRTHVSIKVWFIFFTQGLLKISQSKSG